MIWRGVARSLIVSALVGIGLLATVRIVVAHYALSAILDNGLNCETSDCSVDGIVSMRELLRAEAVYDDANILHKFIVGMLDTIAILACILGLAIARPSKAGRRAFLMVASAVTIVGALLLLQFSFGETVDFATQVTD